MTAHTHDPQAVERIAEAIHDAAQGPGDWKRTLREFNTPSVHVANPATRVIAVRRLQAVAALDAALGDVVPLEDMLGEEGTIDRVLFDSQDWYAAVLLPEGYGSAQGPTIDAAVRAAVANAKGEATHDRAHARPGRRGTPQDVVHGQQRPEPHAHRPRYPPR